MKKVIKKVLLYSSITLLCIIAVFSLFIVGTYLFSDKVQFDINKIKYSNISINLFDNSNRPIKDNTMGSSFVKLHTLNDYTIQAFISIEDKDFYKHHGLNYKRMAVAMLKNITSFKLKEGASTISQQLIKNTHLTNEKTFTRKINEIVLTKKLEKTLTKDQILEYYLNIIYFGDNCYGIENASRYYFSKSAKDLTLSESATLAGMIKSPNAYSPIKNMEKSKQRRNIVLNEMLDDNKITFDNYNNARLSDIDVKITPILNNTLNSYQSAVVSEACDILNMPAKNIAIGEYNIYTYYDANKQKNLMDSFNSYDINSDYLGISISADGTKIEAYYGNAPVEMLNAKRQPGSAIKPILVYAPALNENIISPLTQINDEYININGYSPKNVNDVYHGYVSVRECVSKSLNIPAVKVLSYTGIDKSKYYAKRCGIEFDKSDDNLSIALGGMSYGTSLKQLTNAYSVFSNNGKFTEAKFINYITDKNGKIVYHNTPTSSTILRDDTAYIMTDMLKTCAKSGTGRKLSDTKFEVATKTGTVGNTKNTNAYNISYTTSDIVGIWLGNADNTPIDYVGGGLPTDIVKLYLNGIYKNTSVKPFVMPNSVYKENIDTLSLNNEHIVYKANNYIPQKYITTEIFSRFNPPKEKSTKFISVAPPHLSGKVENGKAVLSFDAQDYLIYEIYYECDGEQNLLSEISNQSGICEQSFDIDKRSQYFIITKIKNYADNTEIISDKSNIVDLVP